MTSGIWHFEICRFIFCFIHVEISMVICLPVAFPLFWGIYEKRSKSKSAIFEWLISFWYGLLLVMWSMDLLPSALRKYRFKHS